MGIKRSRSDSLSSSDSPNSPSSRSRSARAASSDVKMVHLDVAAAKSVMKCSLPPHQPLAFASFEDYHVHYQKTHVNRCQECKKNFPDEHFLHLHIAENHDPISAARRDRGEKIYACLVPTCPRPCSTPQKRRLHMIDKHQFPKDYDFFIVNSGIDRRTSMLRPPQHQRTSSLQSITNGAVGRTRGESSASAKPPINPDANTSSEEEDDDEEEEEETSSENSSEESDESLDDNDAPPPKPKQSQPAKSTKPKVSQSSSSNQDTSSASSGEDSPKPHEKNRTMTVKHAPLKLRGRGGFGRVGQRGTPTSPVAAKKTPAVDAVDGLTAGMSVLQFIPNSVRKARERAKSGAAGK